MLVTIISFYHNHIVHDFTSIRNGHNKKSKWYPESSIISVITFGSYQIYIMTANFNLWYVKWQIQWHCHEYFSHFSCHQWWYELESIEFIFKFWLHNTTSVLTQSRDHFHSPSISLVMSSALPLNMEQSSHHHVCQTPKSPNWIAYIFSGCLTRPILWVENHGNAIQNEEMPCLMKMSWFCIHFQWCSCQRMVWSALLVLLERD